MSTARSDVSGGGEGAVAAAAGGASAVAVLASACCVPVLAPLIVSVFGVAGAIWAAGLKPYAPWALAGAGALLVWGHVRVWSAARRLAAGTEIKPSAEGDASCRPRRRRWVLWVLWGATALWVLAAVINVIQLVAPAVLS